MINEDLAYKQGLTKEDVEDVEEIHSQLDEMLASPNKCEVDPKCVPLWIETYEYNLQAIWGFNKDKHFHRYWYRVKWCTCPKMDNDDYIGIDMSIVNANCPYHGGYPATSWDDPRFKEKQ